MKSIWNGSISFGLVNIPVKLYSAIETKEFKFRMLDDKTNSPIKYKRVSEKTGEEVAWKNIVKGVELTKGKYFIPTKEQLKAIKPEKSDAIDIVEFVDHAQVDPVYIHSHYYVGPAKPKEKTYFLFNEILRLTSRTAIGRFVMREKEYVCTITSYREGLLLTTLNYAYEIRDIRKVDNVADGPKIQQTELELAEELIKRLYKKKFNMEQFRDTFAEEMQKLLKKAEKGETITATVTVKKKKTEDNLIAALKASLD